MAKTTFDPIHLQRLRALFHNLSVSIHKQHRHTLQSASIR